MFVSYLNQPWVRDAIGIDPSFGNYSFADPGVGDAFELAGDHLFPTQLYVAELLQRRVRILIYVGTFDLACN